MTRDNFLYTCVVRYNKTNYIAYHTDEGVEIIYFKGKKEMLDWLENQLQ